MLEHGDIQYFSDQYAIRTILSNTIAYEIVTSQLSFQQTQHQLYRRH